MQIRQKRDILSARTCLKTIQPPIQIWINKNYYEYNQYQATRRISRPIQLIWQMDFYDGFIVYVLTDIYLRIWQGKTG